ncbi:dihydroneopterin aldolase [Microbacterium sp. NEAU-LLB]|uniref:7,8-dihydroneopterin aldolase n=2 Tax=Microbacterium stercoris TaxID=2820289 RepID=A0A939QP20_9MICO|nr:dihydroneopterin aldolase [Microbacterium stercoris]
MMQIALKGLRVFGHHGVFDFERQNGQEFVIDVDLTLTDEAAARAAATDDVAETVHYGEMAEQIAAIVAGEPVNLIETLAKRISDALTEDPKIASAGVTVHKPHAPIPLQFEDVSVTWTAVRYDVPDESELA